MVDDFVDSGLISDSGSRLYNLIVSNHEKVNDFFSQQQYTSYPFYTSADVRQSQFKATPVDINIFPGGWNNVPNTDNAASLVKEYLNSINHEIKRVGILSKQYTNKYAISNLASLARIIENAGYDVSIGSFHISEGREYFVGAAGEEVTLYKLRKEEGKAKINGLEPDILISNDAFIERVPEEVREIDQKILPNPEQGWHKRRKHNHQKIYNRLADEFSKTIGLDDPWLIKPFYRRVDNLDFKQGDLTSLIDAIDGVLGETAKKYAEYSIKHEPYAYVKSNYGSFGMSNIVLDEGKKIDSSQNRKKMHKGLNMIETTDVLVQEAIPTKCDHFENPAEHVVYMIGSNIAGIFMRTSEGKNGASDIANLNRPGQKFISLDKLSSKDPQCVGESILVAKTVAKLGVLAASYEVES